MTKTYLILLVLSLFVVAYVRRLFPMLCLPIGKSLHGLVNG